MPQSPWENAVSNALASLRQVAGSQVTYSRGATTLTVEDAVQGNTEKGVIEQGGSEQVVELADWLIAVVDLQVMGTPEPGDTITRVIDGTTYTWTVEHREYGETHWDWSDTARTTYRIRTRKDGDSAYEISKPTGFDLAGDELTY